MQPLSIVHPVGYNALAYNGLLGESETENLVVLLFKG